MSPLALPSTLMPRIQQLKAHVAHDSVDRSYKNQSVANAKLAEVESVIEEEDSFRRLFLFQPTSSSNQESVESVTEEEYLLTEEDLLTEGEDSVTEEENSARTVTKEEDLNGTITDEDSVMSFIFHEESLRRFFFDQESIEDQTPMLPPLDVSAAFYLRF
ncbi:hypothetical protein BGZ90_003434 [Linnemannia elongata]|nr:hypothetical protein BGZ90_003434 [Linnemannia elongata]